MRNILLTIAACSGLLSAMAQGELYEEPVVVYNRQFYGGVDVNTNGYGVFGCFGRNKGAYNVRLLSLDILFVKHEKETKSYFQDPNARSYFYGKQNNFYELRPGIGRKKIIAEKLRTSGVQVAYSWIGGPVLGFTKPVYLEILHLDENSSSNYYIEVERFDPDKHYIDNIYGRASGLRGFGELKFHPGIFARFSWIFEYSNYKEGLKGLEAGASIDVFPNRIPIMSEKILESNFDGAKNHQVFLGLFINFFFGKKYNRG